MIQNKNIFADLEKGIGFTRHEIQVQDDKNSFFKKEDGDLTKITNKQMLSEVSDVLTLIHDIQEILNTFFKDYKNTSEEKGVKKDEIIKSMKELTRAMDSHIESTLLEMYSKSIGHFNDLIMYLTLGLTIHEENLQSEFQTVETCSIFDYYLSKNIYILRHKAMEKYRKIPVTMKGSLHPKLLACMKTPNLWRRASYISHVVINISKLASKGNFQSL